MGLKEQFDKISKIELTKKGFIIAAILVIVVGTLLANGITTLIHAALGV